MKSNTAQLDLWGSAIETPTTEGVKYDKGKPRLDLIPKDALDALGLALDYGTHKYSEQNWLKGMEWHRIYGAALRHQSAFWAGEDIDPESGLCHLDHALTNLAFLRTYYTRKLGTDDRPIRVLPA